MNKLLQLCLFPTWAVAMATATAQAPALAAKPLRTTMIPCPAGVPAGEIESQTVQCGVVAVPEDRRRPDGRQIELTYAVFKSRSLSPQPDPLIVLHGGPAQNAIPKLEYYMPLVHRHRHSRDVILFDQRGSAHSGELGCAPSSFALDNVVKAGDSPWAARHTALRERLRSPADPDDEFLVPTCVCGQVLQAHGVDLSQYRTTASARDVVDLTTALGHPRVNLYGFSYGTYLAQRVMRDHPHRLRSVVLDSIPASTAAGVEAAYGKRAVPALARMNITAARPSRAVCALWPVRPAPSSDHTLLRSRVPTRVLQGRYDMQTADRSSRRVLEGLRQAHWVEFPNSGHGVFLHSACARDVGAAFVEDPGRAPESGCVRAMTPRFEPPLP